MENKSRSFKEEQRFTQWWLWALLGSILAILIYGIYRQVFLENPMGDHPASTTALVLITLLIIGLVGFFRSIKLTTEVDGSGIRFRLSPFISREIPWSSVSEARMVNYGFVGGWGLRVGTQYGRVYNIRGRYGLSLILKNGDRLLIGTQKKEDLQRFIPEYVGKSN